MDDPQARQNGFKHNRHARLCHRGAIHAGLQLHVRLSVSIHIRTRRSSNLAASEARTTRYLPLPSLRRILHDDDMLLPTYSQDLSHWKDQHRSGESLSRTAEGYRKVCPSDAGFHILVLVHFVVGQAVVPLAIQEAHGGLTDKVHQDVVDFGHLLLHRKYKDDVQSRVEDPDNCTVARGLLRILHAGVPKLRTKSQVWTVPWSAVDKRYFR